jgi:Mrp family chromosome partitioning ATPase/capsular polysaccharide biosynthesis protein
MSAVDVHGREHPSLLSDYVRLVRRRKWIVLMAVFLVPLAAVLLSARQSPLYQASASVLVNTEDLAASLTGTGPQNYQDPIRLIQTQAELARVPALARQVLQSAGVRGMTPGEFLGASAVGTVQNADLLEFSVTHRDPELATRLATEYARQFTLYKYQLDTAAIAKARREVELTISGLETSGDTGSPLHDALVEKEQQLRTLAALKTSNASVVRAADGAGKVRPRPLRNGVLGLALGLFLGLGLAFLWEALDTRLRTADEVADALGLTLLARLPAPPRSLRKQNLPVMAVEPSSPAAEPFHILTTNLDFVNLERRARTILVTSAKQGEGKSTTVANLAVSFARAGRRVSVVDLDLRRPFLHRFFGVEEKPGITDLTVGGVGLEETIRAVPLSGAPPAGTNGRAPSDGWVRADSELPRVSSLPARPADETLWVVTAGTPPPNPFELIRSGALATILERIAATSDLVLIDAPPLLHLGDTIALTARVDALVVLVRLQEAKRPMLKELRRILHGSAAAPLGFVITGAEVEDGYDYAGYEYWRGGREPRRATDLERSP